MDKKEMLEKVIPHKDHHYYVEKLRLGENQIIKEIYQNYAQQINRWVQNNQGEVSDAADVFQEALEVILHKAYDQDFILTCPFSAFLFTICRNKWFDKLKERKREKEINFINLDLYETDNSVDKLLESSLQEEKCQKLLNRTFSQLTGLCQHVLQYVQQGKKPEEIAKLLNMSNSNAVYRRKFACINSWKKLVQADGDYSNCLNY